MKKIKYKVTLIFLEELSYEQLQRLCKIEDNRRFDRAIRKLEKELTIAYYCSPPTMPAGIKRILKSSLGDTIRTQIREGCPLGVEYTLSQHMCM